MSQSNRTPTGQARVPRWTFLWSLFVLALGIAALIVAQRASRARQAQQDRLDAQDAKLAALEAELQAERGKAKEHEQKLQSQREQMQALRHSSFQVTRQPVTLNKTGNEICNERGEVCIAVTPSKVYDAMDRFCGYNMIDCNSRIREAPGCGRTAAGDLYNYLIDRTSFAPSPSGEGTCDEQGRSCLKEPHHNDAFCTSDILERSDSRKAAASAP